MLHRFVRLLITTLPLCAALLACAPSDVPLPEDDASRRADGLEECPTSLTTEAGHDAWNVMSTGARNRSEEHVLQGVAALEASGADPECFRWFTKVLWIVAKNGLGATVLEPMIAAGLDPNLTDIDVDPLCAGCTGTRHGKTTLHYATHAIRQNNAGMGGVATAAERVAMVRTLLDMGADPNLVCSGALYSGGNAVGSAAIGGATPLMFTSDWNDHGAAVEAALMLIDAGAEVNVRSLSSVRSDFLVDEIRSGDTALSLARRRGNAELVEWLLLAGATDWDLEAEERAAASFDKDEIMGILTSKQVDHNRIWTLWFDERLKRAPIQTMLDAGLDPDALTWGGKYTPLWATVFQAGVYARLKPDELHAIVKAGADLAEGGRIGMPPLMVVIDQYDYYNYYVQVVAMLLEAGADVEGRAPDGDTPLLRMMYVRGGLELQNLLIAAGADPNAVNHDGQRPLSVAIRAPKTLQMVDHLLAHGADLNADVGGAPLWAYAIEHNPLYVSDKYRTDVEPILDRFVHHPSLVIDPSDPAVENALSRADSNPLVKPFADVIRARASTWP